MTNATHPRSRMKGNFHVRFCSRARGVTLSLRQPYNAIGQFTTINRYSNLAGTQLVTGTTYSFDALNRLTSLTHNNGTTNTAFYNYVYDAASRITRITDVDGVTNYTYDDRSQLTGANHSNTGNPDETYTYDANGNRTNTGYQTGTGNRLTSDGTFNYQYDSEGNLIKKTEIATGEIQEFSWDYRNRLVAVVDKDTGGNETQRVEFTYDAFDRRIAKTVDTAGVGISNAPVQWFIYNGDDVHLEFVDNDGTAGTNQPVLSQRYLHGPAVDQILAQEGGNGNVVWMLTDHLGTIRDLVNNSGTVVNHLVYDSFGQVISESNPNVDTRYLYTGREFDKKTGLYYYRARYYDASVGRFIGEDAIGFAGGDANLYGYVGNNSINFIDPYGLFKEVSQSITTEATLKGSTPIIDFGVGAKVKAKIEFFPNKINNGNSEGIIVEISRQGTVGIVSVEEGQKYGFENIQELEQFLDGPNGLFLAPEVREKLKDIPEGSPPSSSCPPGTLCGRVEENVPAPNTLPPCPTGGKK